MSDDLPYPVVGKFFGLDDGLVPVRYRGGVAVGSPGRANLSERGGGIMQLVWDGLAQAEWLGHRSGIKPTLVVCMRVPPVPKSAVAVTERPRLRPGGPRRLREVGRLASDGAVYERYEGPLSGRAVAGIQLVESELLPQDFDFQEDMLFTAAVHNGWLSATSGVQAVEVPDVDILVGVSRHRSQQP